MNVNKNPFLDDVFALSAEQFELLQEAIAIRNNKDKYGATNFEELADLYGRDQCARTVVVRMYHEMVIHQMASKDMYVVNVEHLIRY